MGSSDPKGSLEQSTEFHQPLQEIEAIPRTFKYTTSQRTFPTFLSIWKIIIEL